MSRPVTEALAPKLPWGAVRETTSCRRFAYPQSPRPTRPGVVAAGWPSTVRLPIPVPERSAEFELALAVTRTRDEMSDAVTSPPKRDRDETSLEAFAAAAGPAVLVTLTDAEPVETAEPSAG